MNAMNLAKLERDKDVDGLLAALEDSDDRVRVEVVKALGHVGDARAVPALTLLLADLYSVDPRDLYRGDRAWEEMGDESPIYPVREAAREALKSIASRPAEAQGVDAPSIQEGDLVREWRHYFCGTFEDGEYKFRYGTWRVLSLGPEDVHLWLEEGKYWDWNRATEKGINRMPGFTIHLKNSESYNEAFPDSLPYQEFLDTFKKVG